MRESSENLPGTRWAVYQNHDLRDYWGMAYLKFLAVGPHNTCKAPPVRTPAVPADISWRFLHIGYVDLKTGRIIGF